MANYWLKLSYFFRGVIWMIKKTFQCLFNTISRFKKCSFAQTVVVEMKRPSSVCLFWSLTYSPSNVSLKYATIVETIVRHRQATSRCPNQFCPSYISCGLRYKTPLHKHHEMLIDMIVMYSMSLPKHETRVVAVVKGIKFPVHLHRWLYW